MRKTLTWSLLLMALVALVCIFSDGQTTLGLFAWSLRMATPLVILGFTAIGIVIGVLLK